MKITDFVYTNSKVYFDSYRAGFFYYNVFKSKTFELYQFIVPVEDIGTATLLQSDKAITFMRWIRKSIEEGTLLVIDKDKFLNGRAISR